jgi:hypothetical protein
MRFCDPAFLNLLQNSQDINGRAGMTGARCRETDMLKIKASPIAAKSRVAFSSEYYELVTVGLFCGIGLLLSLLAIIVDQHVPGEWF